MKKIILLFFFIFTLIQLSISQDVMMQGWYWDYPKTCDGHSWVDTLHTQSLELAQAGFTHLWLPPTSRASFGNCSNGYDPKDLYDLGAFGLGPTGFGTRNQLDVLINTMNTNGIKAVADVVYNHRDGGNPENNPALENYIENYTIDKSAFPSDRFRCILALGGNSGNNAGDYYFKISSKTGDGSFYNKPYVFYTETDLMAWQNLPDLNEVEPNGGGDCSEASNTASIGVNMNATIDAGGCRTDEFKVTINAGDFNTAGDFLYIYLTNPNGDYSDHRIYGIWNAAAGQDVVSQMEYQTYTDFTQMPSGQGAMNFENFKPNSGNSNTTSLGGDWDWLWFFYDYDQSIADTQTKLFDWTKWLWNDVGYKGFRMDAVKHFDPVFVGDLMDELHDNGIDPDLVVGEFYDANPAVLKNWLDDVRNGMDADTKAAIKVKVFDFALREALKNASDAFGYDVRNVFNSGLVDGVGESGFNTVTFLNNHDFRDANQPIQNDPMLGYAYLLTNNQIGLPCVFYPDYYGTTIPHSPTEMLKPQIDQLISIQQQFIAGSSAIDHLSRFGTPYTSNYTSGFDHTTLLYQLSGGVAGKEIIVAINFAGEALHTDHQINLSQLSIGDDMIELTGNANQTLSTIDASGQMHIEIPARSYAVWVNAGCIPSLVHEVPVSSGLYEVSDFIHSSGLLLNGTHVDYDAGNLIELQPGFEVQLGAFFSAEIKTCN